MELLVDLRKSSSNSENSHLPSWLTIAKNFEHGFKHFSINTVVNTFSENIFGKFDARGKLLKTIQSGQLNVMERIAWELTRIRKPENFISESNVLICPHTNERMYTHFGNGKRMESLSKIVRAKYGPNAVPLVLVAFWDSTLVTETHTECPMSLAILNVLSEDYKLGIVGYLPINLPHRHQELVKLIRQEFKFTDVNTGLTTLPSKDLAKGAFNTWQRDLKRNLAYNAFQGIQDCQDTGVYLQVGTNATADCKNTHLMIPILGGISGDTAEQDDVAGSSWLKTIFSCRRCMLTNPRSFSIAVLQLYLGATVELLAQVTTESLEKKYILRKWYEGDQEYLLRGIIMRITKKKSIYEEGEVSTVNDDIDEYTSEKHNDDPDDYSVMDQWGSSEQLSFEEAKIAVERYKYYDNSSSTREYANSRFKGIGGIVIRDDIVGILVQPVQRGGKSNPHRAPLKVHIDNIMIATSAKKGKFNNTPIPAYDQDHEHDGFKNVDWKQVTKIDESKRNNLHMRDMLSTRNQVIKFRCNSQCNSNMDEFANSFPC